MTHLDLRQPGSLTLGCGDLHAPPLFELMQPDGSRAGYEPAAAALIAAVLGLHVTWVPLEWSDFYPALHERRVDAIWCGQGITAARQLLADFTRPYAVFNESLIVRPECTVTAPDQLAGLRIAAIAGSTNLALAETFPGVELVPFDGATADVFGDMVAAVRSGAVDGFVDDDVVMVPLDLAPDLRLAFTVETRNQWGVAVRRGDDPLREALDAALAVVSADGRLQAVWQRELNGLPWPLG